MLNAFQAAAILSLPLVFDNRKTKKKGYIGPFDDTAQLYYLKEKLLQMDYKRVDIAFLMQGYFLIFGDEKSTETFDSNKEDLPGAG